MRDSARGNKRSLVLSILFLACAVLLFVAGILAYSHIKNNAVSYTPDEVTAKIMSDLKYTDLVKVEPGQISKHYDLPNGVVTSFSVYMSKTSESAAELNCFLLTDTSKYDKLQACVTAHMSTKAAGYKSLNPTQYNQLKDYAIVRRGRYVLVTVGNDTASAEKAFRNIFGGNAD